MESVTLKSLNRPSSLLTPLIATQFAMAGALAFAGVVGFPGDALRAQLMNLAYLVIGVPTAVAVYRAVRRPDIDAGSRRAWMLMGLAVISYWLGDAIWAVIAMATGTRPPLSVADILYVAFSPLALWGLVTFPGLGATRAERWRVQLDAAIVAITVGTVMYWLSPVSEETKGFAHWLSDTLNMSYPLVDMVLLSALLVLMMRQTHRDQASTFRLLVAGIGLKTIADVLYADAVLRETALLPILVDACWLSWYGFISLSARRATVFDATDTVAGISPKQSNWLAYACVAVLGTLLLVLVHAGELPPVRGVSVGVIILLVAVLIRQSIVVGENARLDGLAASRAADGRLAALVHHATDLILVVDVDGTVRYVSPSVQTIMRVNPERMIGRNILRSVHADDVDVARLMLARLARRTDEQEQTVCRAARGDGEWRWLEVTGTNRLHTESIQGLVLNARDVTERRELEGRIEWQAFHDPMTSLANRVLFSDRVSHALARRERGVVDIGVLFIDLDHFKIVNDSFGHAAGDELLRQVARRIELEVRAADTVARLGGDEFAVLLEDYDAATCLETAERLRQSLTRPFLVEGREAFIGASIGVTDAAPGVTLDELVRDADVAMYVAKAEGRGRVVRFEPTMREKVADRLLLEADLRRAVERDELLVHYQPLVDLQTGEILGAEALLRWHHPTRGLITPSVFIPIAEDAGLISEISRRVLRTACRDAMTWKSPDPDAATLHVAVNLSGRHLQEATVVDDVRDALTSTGLDASRLTIEMTESVMMQNADVVIAAMRALKALGVTLALDDFGTGYSSLSYLQRFPIDVLKIDRSFITQLGGAASNDALTRAILSLGETLGLVTVAEGIEGERQLIELQSLGCLLGQGFLMSQPIAGPAFARLVASGEPLHRVAALPTPARGVPLVRR
ncbi:MAG: EAL domain-containing protein [Gemmatimonadaceae bacterium]|nr:EAL domain-containing protein [Gemmatimonadaceae bacterium]